jgi:antitoxin (DNA-binding transcriptional repressor) of toxin-antitoxin stability system
MAVIHISEADAARDLPSLLAKVRAGAEVLIDSDSESFRIVSVAGPGLGRQSERGAELQMGQPRLLSEVLVGLREDASNAQLDDEFGNDVEEGIRSHEQERLIDPWESF